MNFRKYTLFIDVLKSIISISLFSNLIKLLKKTVEKRAYLFTLIGNELRAFDVRPEFVWAHDANRVKGKSTDVRKLVCQLNTANAFALVSNTLCLEPFPFLRRETLEMVEVGQPLNYFGDVFSKVLFYVCQCGVGIFHAIVQSCRNDFVITATRNPD